MLRAKIAERTIELNGCDSMPHAADFSLFASVDAPVQFRMDVLDQNVLPVPLEPPTETCGEWRKWQLENGKTRVIHNSRNVTLETDERFTHVQMCIHPALEQRDVFQYLQVARAFSWHLQHYGGCLLHSAGVSLNGDGVALCGKSGIGKSTLARHLQTITDTVILSEDLPAVVEHATGMRLYGTPFCGGDTQCADGWAPLCTIVLLRQAPHNRLYTAPAEEAVYELLGAVSRPSYMRQTSELAVDRVMHLTQCVPILLFENDGTAQAAAYLTDALSSKGILHR